MKLFVKANRVSRQVRIPHIVWWKFHGGIHTQFHRSGLGESQGRADMDIQTGLIPPDGAELRERALRLRYGPCVVDNQQGFIPDPDVARVLEVGDNRMRESLKIFREVALLHENHVVPAIPCPGPVFIGPTQTEREIGLLCV